MKPATVLLQVVLVAGGILVYDALRDDPAPASTSDLSPEPAAPSAGKEDARVAALRESLDRLAARVASLEAARVPVPALPRREEAPDPAPSPVAPRPRPPPPVVPHVGEITAEELARFRALQDAAARQRAAEALRASLAAGLATLPVRLSADQQGAVLDEAVRMHRRAAAVRRDLLARGAGAERLRADLASLRAEFARSVGGLVPGSHGDIVAGHLTDRIGLGAAAAQVDDEEAGG